MATTSEETLIFTREHPEYHKNKKLWERLRLAYSGGKEYIEEALIRHLSELELEFDERKTRAYYFNYVRRVPNRITEFILSDPPVRKDATKEIVEDFDRFGNRVDYVMRQWEIKTLLYGLSWLLVDSPAIETDENGVPLKKNIADKKNEKLRPYGLPLEPLCVPDWDFGQDGGLEWAIIESQSVESASPFTEPVQVKTRTLWTREYWKTYTQKVGSDVSTAIEVGEQVPHELGRVPLVMRLKVDTTGMGATHFMADVLRISDAILNNESECQINIVKQVFGLLVVPESFKEQQQDLNSQSGTPSVQKGETWGRALSRSFAVSENGEDEKGITRYISPPANIVEGIEKDSARLKKELFDVIGLAIRTETAQRESADAKAWDNQAASAFLKSEADSMEEAETKAWELFNLWDKSIAIPKVSYNRDYNIQDFKTNLMAITEIMSLEVGDKFQKRIMKTALNILDKIEKISLQEKEEIVSEIEALTLGSPVTLGSED